MIKQLRRLYDYIIELSATPKAVYALAFVSFIESSIFPIPPDVMLIPMMLANRQKAFFYAFICTISSVLGGIAGYYIGAVFYETIGHFIISLYGYEDGFTRFTELYNAHGAWIVGMGGVTPFPYKIITILSGITHMDLFAFTLISIGARGVRFFALAFLLWFFGDRIKTFIDKYFGLLTLLFFGIIILGFLAIKWII